MKILFFILFLLYTMSLWGQHQAPAPLFRDPITDGAADPVLIWNRTEKNWWMLYTQRRANSETADVAYCYGNQIGIASWSKLGLPGHSRPGYRTGTQHILGTGCRVSQR
jgi:hypothetical protein